MVIVLFVDFAGLNMLEIVIQHIELLACFRVCRFRNDLGILDVFDQSAGLFVVCCFFI